MTSATERDREIALEWLVNKSAKIATPPDRVVESLAALLATARDEGLERAAVIAEKVRDMNLPTASYSWNGACKWIAQAIRSEKQS